MISHQKQRQDKIISSFDYPSAEADDNIMNLFVRDYKAENIPPLRGEALLQAVDSGAFKNF